MENRTTHSPKRLSETASRYLYLTPLPGLDRRETGKDSSTPGVFRNDKNHASLNWSSSPDFAFLSLARFHREQDAWNSLHVTGLKPPAKVTSPQGPKKSPWCDDSHGKVSRDAYNETAENHSPVIHSAYSDSGYGSKCSGSTQSVISSSCPVESTSSPGIVSSYNCIDKSNHPGYNPSSLLDTVGGHFQIDYPIKCSYFRCPWTGKCASDKKKHEARHKREFRCEEPGCRRKEGFGTINDLERHQKCVHGKVPDRGPKKVYMCFGKNCRRPSKKWPRLDNFRQHLGRVHPEEDAEELLRKSDDWYDSIMRRIETANSLVDLSTMSPPRQPSPLPQIRDSHVRGIDRSDLQTFTDGLIAPCQMTVSDVNSTPPSEELTLSPIRNIDTFDAHNGRSYGVNGAAAAVEGTSEQVSVSPPRIRQPPVELPGLRSLNLPPLEETPSAVAAPVPERSQVPPIAGTGKALDGVVANVINAFTRGLNKTTRKQGIYPEQGKDHNDNDLKTPAENATPSPRPPHKSETANADSLSDSQRKYLSTVLSAVLEQLGGQAPAQVYNNLGPHQVAGNEPESRKQAGYQCNVCGKMKRLKCELKKHKTRHEKPFGCTFDRCYRTFGSKADWKRHESSQHFHLQSWRCSLPCTKRLDVECARLYYRQELFVKHLRKHHRIAEGDSIIGDSLVKNRIGRNGQSQYWCGFCRKIIVLEHKGLDAWNERFDHIDSKHFKQGQRITDWIPAKGHHTKEEIVKRAKMKKKAGESMAASKIPAKEWLPGDSDSESDINSIGSMSSAASSCIDSDDEEYSLGLAKRSHQDSPAAEGHTTVSSEIGDVEAGNGSLSHGIFSLHNSRKRKFSPESSPECPRKTEVSSTETEVYQHEREVERGVKRIKSMPDLSPGGPSGYDDEHRNHPKTTSYSLTAEGRRVAAPAHSGTRAGPDYQPSVFCCNCKSGPSNLLLMPGCVDCGHVFCDYCTFESSQTES